MYRATTTLVLLIAILGTGAQSTGLLSERAAAQNAPTATIGTPQTAEATSSPEKTATTEPTAAATLDLAPTSTPEPISPPEPTADGHVPRSGRTAEGTATQTSDPADGLPTAQPEKDAVPGSSEAPLTLSVAAKEVSFGKVSATGELDPAIAGLSSETDEHGASYVLADAVVVTVTAGVPWTGACEAQENAGTATTVAVSAGRLEWRLAGTTTWTPFSPSGLDSGCFPSPDLGTRTFVYDLRLRVDADDPAGSFQTVLVFTVEP